MFSSERRLVEYQVRGQKKDCYVLDKIRTPTDAYVIGLLCADSGFALSKGKYPRTTFYSSEEWSANKISEFFGGSVRTRMRDINITNAQGRNYKYGNNTSYEVHIPSKSSQSLGKYGINSIKKERVMAAIPKHLFKCAVLGFLDGDGSIVVRRRKDCRTDRLNIHIVTSCQKVLTHTQRELENTLNISSSIYVRSENCWDLRINNTKSAIKFCQWIYGDLPDFYSKRKHKVFTEYLSCVSSDELLESESQSAAKPTE